MTRRRCQYCDTMMPGSAMTEDSNGWCCRSLLQCFNRLLLKYNAMRVAGNRLSNIAFNLSQHAGSTLTAYWCETMRESYQDWDQVKKGKGAA